LLCGHPSSTRWRGCRSDRTGRRAGQRWRLLSGIRPRGERCEGLTKGNAPEPPPEMRQHHPRAVWAAWLQEQEPELRAQPVRTRSRWVQEATSVVRQQASGGGADGTSRPSSARSRRRPHLARQVGQRHPMPGSPPSSQRLAVPSSLAPRVPIAGSPRWAVSVWQVPARRKLDPLAARDHLLLRSFRFACGAGGATGCASRGRRGLCNDRLWRLRSAGRPRLAVHAWPQGPMGMYPADVARVGAAPPSRMSRHPAWYLVLRLRHRWRAETRGPADGGNGPAARPSNPSRPTQPTWPFRFVSEDVIEHCKVHKLSTRFGSYLRAHLFRTAREQPAQLLLRRPSAQQRMHTLGM